MSVLEARDVGVDYRGQAALGQASVAVASGEVVGLIGPNGAGKTTLLRAMAGLLRPSRGRVLFEDRDITGVGRREIARAISYLPSGAPCHWPLAVRHVVALGRLPFSPPGPASVGPTTPVIDRVMAEADVQGFAGRQVTTLSSGERMRVMVARALAQIPKVLLADEPIAALDPYHQLRVMELIAGLGAHGSGVLAVLHDLSLAARYCDRLILLVDGAIAAVGKPDEVLTPETLRAAYGVDVVSGEAGSQVFALPPSQPQSATGVM